MFLGNMVLGPVLSGNSEIQSCSFSSFSTLFILSLIICHATHSFVHQVSSLRTKVTPEVR